MIIHFILDLLAHTALSAVFLQVVNFEISFYVRVRPDYCAAAHFLFVILFMQIPANQPYNVRYIESPPIGRITLDIDAIMVYNTTITNKTQHQHIN